MVSGDEDGFLNRKKIIPTPYSCPVYVLSAGSSTFNCDESTAEGNLQEVWYVIYGEEGHIEGSIPVPEPKNTTRHEQQNDER